MVDRGVDADAVAHGVGSLGRLDLHHVGSEGGQVLGAHRPGQEGGEVEDPYAGQGQVTGVGQPSGLPRRGTAADPLGLVPAAAGRRRPPARSAEGRGGPGWSVPGDVGAERGPGMGEAAPWVRVVELA